MTDRDISIALKRAGNGSVGNRIGSFIIKQEVARLGEGRKTACRAIVAFSDGKVSIILHVFEKSKKQNITRAEKKVFEDNAANFLGLTTDQIDSLIANRGWREVDGGSKSA